MCVIIFFCIVLMLLVLTLILGAAILGGIECGFLVRRRDLWADRQNGLTKPSRQ